jgi:hypothetical protein
MINKIIEIYKEYGYELIIDNKGVLAYWNNRLVPNARLKKNGTYLNTGWGINYTDTDIFCKLKNIVHGPIYVLGNAFGFSTFILAELFPSERIDVMDAVSEGSDSIIGHELTIEIAKKYYPNVNLTLGYSPDDLPKSGSYGFILIDAEHTDNHLWMDWVGCEKISGHECAIYLHDVELFNLHITYERIKKEYPNWIAMDLDTTAVGCKLLVRGYDIKL